MKRTFREEANEVLGKARRLQMAGVAMMLGVFFFLPFCPWLGLVAAGGAVLMWVGHWQLRKLRCPGCRRDLRFLVYDPGYSGMTGWVSPRVFAPKIRVCGYCGRRFDEVGEDSQDGEDGTAAARQDGDGAGESVERSETNGRNRG